jgi:protein SCO1/2
MTITGGLRGAWRIAVATALMIVTAPALQAQDDHAAHATHPVTPVPTAPLPGASLYQLPMGFTTAAGSSMQLAQYRGQPVVVTMFYGTCKAACPLLTRAMTETAASLPSGSRDKVRFLMVTLDPERDTQAELSRFAREHDLASPRFEVARTDSDGVRLLAAALGIRYRQLPDGNFSHSAVLTVLDADGVPRARTETIAAADPEFVVAVAKFVR